MEYFNSKIQLDRAVIDDIILNLGNKKMLVFGLGYDSKMWYEGNNKNTFFVENNDKYILLNKDIPESNIIKYEYKTSVSTSLHLSDESINNFAIPRQILQNAPYDIILIDGPEGFSSKSPGRLIPCFWSTQLASSNSIIYIDDASRVLEDYCVKKYFSDKNIQIFNKRGKCIKILF